MRSKEELERAMSALKEKDTKENRERLLKILEESVLYVPAVLPPDTPPELIRKIVQSHGEQQIPDGVSPRPLMLENGEGKYFLPLFSTEEQAKKKNLAPLILTLPFPLCRKIVSDEEKISGMVLNAFEQNITLNSNVQPPKKENTLTAAQMHVLLRQRLEASLLPETIFAEPAACLEQLRQEQGAFLMALYEQIYPQNLACPYEADDFDVINLHIRDDLTVSRIYMPTANAAEGTCPLVLAGWNPLRGKLRYFGIVRGAAGEEPHIYEAFADGTKRDLGRAPDEGQELQFIIDLESETEDSKK